MSEPSIVVQGLGKSYRRTQPVRNFREWWQRRRPGQAKRDPFWALRDVSCQINPGTMVGVLGGNGAGKSTLLRLIGGVGKPDRGRIVTRGTIRALLDLGSGMQPDLTGVENTFFFGVVAGLTRHEVQKRLESIVAFAELEKFIDNPMRTYSTGMQMRLAFAIAVHTDPGILLVDEVLAVGDLGFQRKCLDRIREIKKQGCAILFVSHDTVTVRRLCDEAIWLRSGQLVASGPAEVVAGQYLAEMSVETQRRTAASPPNQATGPGSRLQLGVNRFGSLEMEISEVAVRDRFNHSTREIESGDALIVDVTYFAPKPVPSPIFNVSITDHDGRPMFDVNTDSKGNTLPALHGEGKLSLHIDRLDLQSGSFYVSVGVYEAAWSYAYDYHWHICELTVHAPDRQFGLLHIPHRWEMQPTQAHVPRRSELRPAS